MILRCFEADLVIVSDLRYLNDAPTNEGNDPEQETLLERVRRAVSVMNAVHR